MDIKTLNQLNPHICIKHVEDTSFADYGNILQNYDFSELIEYMDLHTSIPTDMNIYFPSIPEMEACAIYNTVQQEFYGEMPVQIGYCNGKNSSLNGLEYHKGNEINIAVTDIILLLGKVQDISNNIYRSDKVEAFYIPKNTAVELYGTTLHFAPCKTTAQGFKCIVILPKGTNEPLKHQVSLSGKISTLFARNKWLLAHPDRKQLIDKGAYPGIIGENIEIKYE